MRSSQSWLFNQKDRAPAAKATDSTFEPLIQAQPIFEATNATSDTPDFGNISAGDLRRHARQSFDAGAIDGETYATLSEPLPMQTIDPMGNLVDLSGISDATCFDFRKYYGEQLQIAKSIGDPWSVHRLTSAVDFLQR